MTSSSPSTKRSLTSGGGTLSFPFVLSDLFRPLRAKWSVPKFLYVFSRYYSLFHLVMSIYVSTNAHLSLSVCRGWLWFVAYSGPVISAAAVDALLIIRLYAIYQGDRRMLVFLSSLYIIEFSIIISIASHLLSGTQAATPQTTSLPLTGCLVTKSRSLNISLIAWIPNLLISCTFFVLTLYKFAQFIRIVSGSSFWTTLGEVKNIYPIMALFVRDGAMCFGMVFAAVLLNTIFIITSANDPLNQMGTAWLIATYAVAASRLLLNLRGFRDGLGSRPSTTVDLRTIETSGITFKNEPPKRNTALESGSHRATFTDTIMNTRINNSGRPTQSSSRTAGKNLNGEESILRT